MYISNNEKSEKVQYILFNKNNILDEVEQINLFDLFNITRCFCWRRYNLVIEIHFHPSFLDGIFN